MTRKNTNAFLFLKKINIFDVLFLISFLTSIIMSFTMEREKLLYISPIVVLTILIKYLSVTKQKANLLFVIALFALIAINFLTFYSFQKYFVLITMLTCFYLIIYSLILKKYLNKSNIKKILSLSVLIGCLLIGYIIFSVIDLILNHIPNYSVIYVFLCASSLFIYVVIFSRIYLNNNYDNTIIIFASGIASLFNIGLSPINEYYFYNKTFTILILICHYLSIYLFMKFISETNSKDKKNIEETYF